MTRQHRRAQRRAESRFFEPIEAADAGDLRLANELLEQAAPPRRTRPTTIEKERTSIQRGVTSRTPSSSPTDFHVIRLVGQSLMEAWKQLEPVGRKHRGLVSLMRRQPDRLDPHQALRLRAYLDDTSWSARSTASFSG